MSNDSTSASNYNWELVPTDSTQEIFAVPDGQPVTIGRQSSCDMVIADSYISRQHASLEVRDGDLYLKDLDSTQGTFVNDTRITETQVNNGDVIRMEKHNYTVRQLDHGDGAADDVGATVIRKIPDPAEAGTVVAKSVQPPPEEKPAAPPPPPEEKPAAPPPPPPAAEPGPAASEDSADAGQQEAQDGAVAGKGNWWEKQQEGPKGTELFKVGDLGEADVSAPRADIVADGPMLVGLSGACKDQEFRLQSGKFIMGKGDNADIHIADTTVSDVHAQVIGDGVSWQVVNLMSSNGTFVNGKKVQTAFLSPGDVIRMGGIELQFVDNASAGGYTASAGSKSLPGWVVPAAILIAVLAVGVFGLSYFEII